MTEAARRRLISSAASVGIVGYNGAGKTTLLKVMCGIYSPSAQFAGPDRRRHRVPVRARDRLRDGGDGLGQHDHARGCSSGCRAPRSASARVTSPSSSSSVRRSTDPSRRIPPACSCASRSRSPTAITPDVLLLDEVIAGGRRASTTGTRRRLEMVERASILVLVSHRWPRCARCATARCGCTTARSAWTARPTRSPLPTSAASPEWRRRGVRWRRQAGFASGAGVSVS